MPTDIRCLDETLGSSHGFREVFYFILSQGPSQPTRLEPGHEASKSHRILQVGDFEGLLIEPFDVVRQGFIFVLLHPHEVEAGLSLPLSSYELVDEEGFKYGDVRDDSDWEFVEPIEGKAFEGDGKETTPGGLTASLNAHLTFVGGHMIIEVG